MAGHRRLLLSSGKSIQPILLGKRFAAHERRHERFPVLGRLQGHIIHDDGRATEVLLGDISKGGLSYFVSPRDALLQPNSKIVLKISLGGMDQILECAFTLRDRRVDERGYLRHGLQVASSAKDLAVLSKLEEFVRIKQLATMSDAA